MTVEEIDRIDAGQQMAYASEWSHRMVDAHRYNTCMYEFPSNVHPSAWVISRTTACILYRYIQVSQITYIVIINEKLFHGLQILGICGMCETLPDAVPRTKVSQLEAEVDLLESSSATKTAALGTSLTSFLYLFVKC